ncbi:hypothetical protein ACOMHN_019148 [Nucella lapillus]
MVTVTAASRYVAVPEATALAARRLWESGDDVTFLATIRQDVGNSGTIISFSSPLYRYVELESSGQRDEIRFYYRHQQHDYVQTFPYRLDPRRWHRLALTLSGSRLTLRVNCSQIYSRVLMPSADRSFPEGRHTPSSSSRRHPVLQVFVGQRNRQHSLFRGALQDVKIVTQAHGYLLQCPNQDTDCPTCSQYQALENQVQEMYRLYKNISEKLRQAEAKLSMLEGCQCLQSCNDRGTVRSEGQVWERDKCSLCRCRNGTVDCRNVECPPADCKHPVYRDGECCPVCLTNCYNRGKYYDHGETISPRVCVTCTCDDGKMMCKRQDPKTSCPPLTCPVSEQIQVQGKCCPVCKGTDFCFGGHDCHHNASCVNLATQYACQCNGGFQGDGNNCQDIDECATEGGKYGHHCHSHTVCVNSPGSYRCQCRQGYRRLDDYSCQEDHATSHHSSSAPTTSTATVYLLLLLLTLSCWTGWPVSCCLSGRLRPLTS